MASTKIAINGFGRIGRLALRQIINHLQGLEVVAINDLSDSQTLAHLLKYDSSYGIFDKEVSASGEGIEIGSQKIRVFNEKDPLNLPWKDLKIDIVLECTGVFTDYEGAEKHLQAGAKRVIISAPSKNSDKIHSFVLGVNEEKFDPKVDLISDMGSCTTNCLAPIAKVINDGLGIVKGFMTTIHSYTNDQRILDLAHKDLRRARTAGMNIIPTTTGAAKAIGNVIPELKGKFDGLAFRVPTATVSSLDLVCEVEKDATKEEVNQILEEAASKIPGILGIEEKPLVSSDFIGNPLSSIVDSNLTMANGRMIKVVAWYDNEWAYATRLGEFAEFVGKRI